MARPAPSYPVTHVEYDAIRGQVRDGDVVLFGGSGLLSRWIEFESKGPFSHAGICAWWDGRLMLLQAEVAGLQAVPFSAFVGRYEGRTDWWPLTDAARKPEVVERVLWEARSVLGRPYSFWKLAEVASHVMIHTRLPKAETDPGAMFCSEFVAHCFRVGGLDISPHSDVNTSPTDIAASGHFRYGGTVRHDPSLAPNVRQDRIDLLRARHPRPAPAPKKAG
jgi:hypothetical protein